MTLDEAMMDRALMLARERLGRTAPNPSVGCVIVDQAGSVAGDGATGAGGSPHAEEAALIAAGAQARGGTAYVTLEPCAARSSGAPSCARRLIEAGVMRVAYACADPHPLADGCGPRELREAGVEVVSGLRAKEAEALNAGFFSVLRRGRPLVAIDSDASSYDAEATIDPSADLAAELSALAKHGLTRVRVEPDSSLAQALRQAGLVDIDDSRS